MQHWRFLAPLVTPMACGHYSSTGHAVAAAVLHHTRRARRSEHMGRPNHPRRRWKCAPAAPENDHAILFLAYSFFYHTVAREWLSRLARVPKGPQGGRAAEPAPCRESHGPHRPRPNAPISLCTLPGHAPGAHWPPRHAPSARFWPAPAVELLGGLAVRPHSLLLPAGRPYQRREPSPSTCAGAPAATATEGGRGRCDDPT